MNNFIAAALVVAGISFTITVTSIFKFLRERISKWHPKLEELIHCPYCLSHYVTFILLATWQGGFIIVSQYWIYNYLFTAFAIVALSGVIHYILLRSYKPVAEAMALRHIEKLNS